MERIKKFILSTILLILISSFIFPEVLILENGKIIDGKIIKMSEDTMTIITKSEELVIDRDDVIQTFRSMDDYNKFKESLKSNNEKVPEKGNLIAKWLFTGNANDTSGNELNGKVFGTKELVEDRFGKKDSAYEFGPGKTRLIRVDKNINILQRQIFSISVWIKIKKSSSYQRIFDLHNWNNKKGYLLAVNSDDSIFFGCWLIGGSDIYVGIPKNVNKNVWHHLVVTFNSKKTKFFLNGKFIEEKSVNNINYSGYNDLNFYIGGAGSNDPNSYQFYGCIDDIRFYDYTLSEDEINNLYHENGWAE